MLDSAVLRKALNDHDKAEHGAFLADELDEVCLKDIKARYDAEVSKTDDCIFDPSHQHHSHDEDPEPMGGWEPRS